MKTNKRIVFGLLLTVVIFVIANVLGKKIDLGIDFLSFTFATHTIMLILSVLAIVLLQKSVDYKFSLPKFKKILRPLLFGFLASLVPVLMAIITFVLGGKNEPHPALIAMSAFQTFVFVLIYASIAEEFLFRGFLQNILKPLSASGIKIFKRFVSLPVIIGAVAFGLAHTVLFFSGVGIVFVVRTVIFTMLLGLVAGYCQEKHNNHAYAIVVHMAGNALGVLSALLMGLNA